MPASRWSKDGPLHGMTYAGGKAYSLTLLSRQGSHTREFHVECRFAERRGGFSVCGESCRSSGV